MEERIVIMEVIEAWEGATLAIGRVDAGLRRCGQVVAASRVVEPGPFVIKGSFPVLVVKVFAFIVHAAVTDEAFRYYVQ